MELAHLYIYIYIQKHDPRTVFFFFFFFNQKKKKKDFSYAHSHFSHLSVFYFGSLELSPVEFSLLSSQGIQEELNIRHVSIVHSRKRLSRKSLTQKCTPQPVTEFNYSTCLREKMPM